MIEHSIFTVMVGLIEEIIFILFSVYTTVQWAENEKIRSILTNGLSTN